MIIIVFKYIMIYIDIEESSENNMSSDSDESSHYKKFTITFSSEEWDTIKPVTHVCKRKRKGVIVGDRKYLTLQPGKWTNVVYEHFHLHTRLPCRISFKKNQVSSNALYYVQIEGNCLDCKSHFTGVVIDKPGETER